MLAATTERVLQFGHTTVAIQCHRRVAKLKRAYRLQDSFISLSVCPMEVDSAQRRLQGQVIERKQTSALLSIRQFHLVTEGRGI